MLQELFLRKITFYGIETWDLCFGSLDLGFFFSLAHYKFFFKYFGYEKLFCFYVRQIILWICQMAVDSWVYLFFRLHKTIFNYEVNVFAVAYGVSVCSLTQLLVLKSEMYIQHFV